MSNVYRVYEAFHDPAESGTFEYGTYSTLDKAQMRMLKVWKDKKYPDYTYSEMNLYAYGIGDSYSISIETIEVDKDIDDKNVGYT